MFRYCAASQPWGRATPPPPKRRSTASKNGRRPMGSASMQPRNTRSTRKNATGAFVYFVVFIQVSAAFAARASARSGRGSGFRVLSCRAEGPVRVPATGAVRRIARRPCRTMRLGRSPDTGFSLPRAQRGVTRPAQARQSTKRMLTPPLRNGNRSALRQRS